jgi:tyrosinase
MSAVPRVRKNIDSLTPQELDDYVHAYTTLGEISDRDPDSVDGLQYFQDLHDTMTGPCEHANDTFLPWHRAHLFLFEEALRRSDPPRTANVTLPYWDFSALPSGKRYPAAFEVVGSNLWDPERRQGPVCRTAAAASCEYNPFPRAYIERAVLSLAHWSSAESDHSQQSFGGFAGGQMDCQGQFGEGFGGLEQPMHNTMHDTFVAGKLADPGTAAQDPIFFVFHCYLDLLWAQWQEHNATDTDLDARLCGLFITGDHSPTGPRFRVRDTLDTTAMGYVYAYTPGPVAPEAPVPADAQFPTHPAVDFVPSAVAEPAVVRSLEFTVPPLADVGAARLQLTHVAVTTPFSYGADVYLLAADADLHTRSRAFRTAHLVNVLNFWRAHHSHADNRHTIEVDLGAALSALADGHAGERWKIAVALTAIAPATDHHHQHGGSGGVAHPSLAAAAGHTHPHGPPDDTASIMNFGDLTLEFGQA